ncbi:hypothetical protein SKAU_G00372150 [Synaphobranchus kaupii]|uniref:Uncharacterized protein n=1 Tax=Synaphobranchus kaupii TaxID=118154 RepID=A0A9Q1IG14_SYNKA|nr:hypothetical protein SKAU_G00372150 [Synaphobranchus kaupii]
MELWARGGHPAPITPDPTSPAHPEANVQPTHSISNTSPANHDHLEPMHPTQYQSASLDPTKNSLSPAKHSSDTPAMQLHSGPQGTQRTWRR